MFFIILCTYRPDLDYLRAQLASISAQTDSDFLCLVQDDASPAELSEKIRELTERDARFLFHRHDSRLGVFHNFEAGLRKTPHGAQFICYCDQDDLWVKDKLEQQRAAFADPSVMLCHTDLALIDEHEKELHPSCFAFEGRNLCDYSLPQLILRNAVTGCTLAFRATLLPKLLPFPYQGVVPRFHHDHYTALIATMYGRIVALSEPLVRYRQHGQNVLGASANSTSNLQLEAHLYAVLRHRMHHLAALEPEWTRRDEWITHILSRAPAHPMRHARLEVLRDWTQKKAGSAYLFLFLMRHLLRAADRAWLGPVAVPVFVGKLYAGALRARQALRNKLTRQAPQPVAKKPSWCQYREIKPLRDKLENQEVCIFAHFDRDGLIDNYVVYHLAQLSRAGIRTIFVSTAKLNSEAELEKIRPYCAAIVERENIGLDFGSWRTGLLLYPEVLQSQTLFFVNDSVYGPFEDLRTIIDKMAATGCDFWGITESLQIQSHYQSYFLGFHRSCLQNQAFLNYINGIELLTDKFEIIRQYEVSMKNYLTAHGLRGVALVPARSGHAANYNPTLHGWQESLSAGAPYLKVQLLRENPHGQAIEDWPAAVRGHGNGYDLELITHHLRRFAAA